MQKAAPFLCQRSTGTAFAKATIMSIRAALLTGSYTGNRSAQRAEDRDKAKMAELGALVKDVCVFPLWLRTISAAGSALFCKKWQSACACGASLRCGRPKIANRVISGRRGRWVSPEGRPLSKRPVCAARRAATEGPLAAQGLRQGSTSASDVLFSWTTSFCSIGRFVLTLGRN